MNRLYFLFFLALSRFAVAQDIDSNPVKNTDRTLNSRPTRSVQSRPQGLPRTEIPGTMRETIEDYQIQPLNKNNQEKEVRTYPTDTQSVIEPVVDYDGQVFEDNQNQSKAADTLEYVPMRRTDE